MAYSAELILSGETYTANIIQGSPGKTGDNGIDGIDGVATIAIYTGAQLLTNRVDRINFTGGGQTISVVGNVLNVGVPFSGSYTELSDTPTIPSDLSELTDTSGILTGYTFDGSWNTLEDKPTTIAGFGITDAFSGDYDDLLNRPTLFSGSYNDLTFLPTLFSESYNDLTDLPNLSVYALTTTLDTNYYTSTEVDGLISGIVDSPPGALNTLNKIAASLGDDPNYAVSTTNRLALKTDDSTLANVAKSGSYDDLSDIPPTFDTSLSEKSTDDLTEGNNQYYTDAKVQAKLGNVSGNIIPDTTETYDLGSPTKKFKELYLSGNSIYLGNNLILFNDNGKFSARDDLNNPVTVSLANNNTDDITEGLTNLYYTTARANADFDNSLSEKKTDNLAEGLTNLYYTDARVDANIESKTTDDLTEGNNLYYTDARVEEKIDAYVTGGTGVTVTSGEIAIGQPVATSDNVTFSDIRSTGNLTIDGDLTVSGSTITLNATNLAVEDNMIYLNSGSAVANPDLGIAGNYNDGTYAHTGMFRDATDGTWKFFQGYTPEPDASSFISTSHASFAYAPVRASNFTGNLTGNVTGNVTGDVTGDVTGTVSSLTNHTTDDLAEGEGLSTNLYYTDTRVAQYLTNNSYAKQTYVTNAIEDAGINYATADQGILADSAIQAADLADVATTGQYSSLTNKPVLAAVATSGLYSDISDRPSLATVATSGTFASLTSKPTTLGGYGITDAASSAQGGRADSAIQPEDLGSAAYTNSTAYATAAQGGKADSAIQSLAGYATETYVNTAVAGKDNTDEIEEGLSNLYYTDVRVDARISNVSGNYATAAQGEKADSAIQSLAGYATETYVNTAVSNLVDSAPGTLNTLNELAAALGDDANFATTITNSIATKFTTSNFASTANDWLALRTTTDVVEGDNLYYTAGRATGAARAALSAAGDLSYDSSTGEFSITSYSTTDFQTDLGNISTTDLSEGQTNLYYTTARANDDFDTRLGTKDTSDLTESLTNLYHTTSRVRGALSAAGDLSYNSATGTFSITAYKTSTFNTDFGAKTTDALTEGLTNKYYTSERIATYLTNNNYALTSDITTAITTASSDYATAEQGGKADSALQSADLSTYATQTYVNTAVSNLVATAPEALDTLNELAAALGDDPNFATTTATAIGLKANTADLGTAAAQDVGYFATAAQGTLAESALQSTDLSTYATETFVGTAISTASSDYATAEQGGKADSALQSVTNDDINWIPYAQLVDLPSATDNHGMFAHVHATGKAYFAHAGEWVELSNSADAVTTASTIDALAVSTSAQLSSVISDETGTGSLVFGTSPTIATPVVTGGTFTDSTLVTPTVAVINGSVEDGGTLTLKSTTSSTKASAGILIDEEINSTSTTTGALVISSGVGIGGTLSVSQISTSQISASEVYADRWTEKLNTDSSSLSGVVDFSYLNGTSYYHTGFLGDFTANFTNVPVTDNRTIVFIIMVEQGETAYAPTAVQIDGTNVPINFLNNTEFLATPSNIDQFMFTLIRTNSSWKVLGTIITHGASA